MRQRLTTPRRHDEGGSAAVEFALVLPLLVLLLFGIIDFGRMLNAEITLTTAAREGARATALFGRDAGADRVAAASGDLDPAATITACPDDPGPDDDATVEVIYEFSFVTPINVLAGLGGGDGAITLSATSVMPCLG